MLWLIFNCLVTLGCAYWMAAGLTDRYGHSFRRAEEKSVARQIRLMSASVAVRLPLRERLHLRFLVRSGLFRRFPGIHLLHLMVLCVASGAVTAEVVMRFTGFLPTSLAIGLLGAGIPLALADLLAGAEAERLQHSLAAFTSVLSRWCAVREDILFIFEHARETGLPEPLNTLLHHFLIRVRQGMPMDEALERMGAEADSPAFRDFLLHMRQNLRHRGDLKRLFTRLEHQHYQLEEEWQRRRISTWRDRVLLYGTMAGVLVMGGMFIRMDPRVAEFYLQTHDGQWLLALFALLYTLGCLMAAGIGKMKM